MVKQTISLRVLYITCLVFYAYLTNAGGSVTFMEFSPVTTKVACVSGYELFARAGISRERCALLCLSNCRGVRFEPGTGMCHGCGLLSEIGANTDMYPDSVYYVESAQRVNIVKARFGEDSGLTDRGRVEIRFNGTWGTICDDRWQNHLTGHEQNNYNVMCRMLGFTGSGSILPKASYLADKPLSELPIWMDDVECGGTEMSILNCPFAGIGNDNCGRDEDVNLKCVSLVSPALGQCTFSSVSGSLNTCTSVASGTANTRWMFPYGTTPQQATFCQSDVQANLSTCVQSVIWPCMSYDKISKTFGTNGTNLINAYTNLCAHSLVTDAQACMSVISPISTYTTAETSYVTSADALHTTASYTEMCGLVLTLHYTAYTSLLTATCTTSSHLAVWTAFFNDIIYSYVCQTCAGSNVIASIWLPFVMTCVARVIRV